ncbi:MAG: thioredoxin family protein [Flavobacteriales bacterium]|jgi:thioredoxin-related protein|nr:thioredoxin family protein [Flavobacteriales bacterium]
MKKLSTLALFLIGFSAVAQITSVTNLNEAKSIATLENKTIMIVFSGSDWCVPCMRLEKEILSQPEFENFEAKKIVLLKADFPTRSKNKKLISQAQQDYNAKLFEKYNPKGIFPLVVLLNSDAKVIAETGYKNMSSGAYASYINDLVASKDTQVY